MNLKEILSAKFDDVDGLQEWVGGIEFESAEAMAFAMGMVVVVGASIPIKGMGNRKLWDGVAVGAGFAFIVGGVATQTEEGIFFGAGMITGAMLLEVLYGKIGAR
jgi:hypothetical protein